MGLGSMESPQVPRSWWTVTMALSKASTATSNEMTLLVSLNSFK